MWITIGVALFITYLIISSKKKKQAGGTTTGETQIVVIENNEPKPRSIIRRGSTSLKYQEFVAVDIETTGLDPFKDKIIEIGAAKYINGQLVDTFSCLVNPECNIPSNITKINGITNKMVKNERTIEEIMPEFLNFVGDLPLLAHNCSFELKFLINNLPPGNELNNSAIDTLKIARKLFPEIKNHKLGTVTEYLGIINNNQHRALNDAIAAAEIYLKCQSKLNNVS